jgi:hypothetical protein
MTGLIVGAIIYDPEPLESPLPGTCSHAVPSQTRRSPWIFERNGNWVLVDSARHGMRVTFRVSTDATAKPVGKVP